MPLAMNIPNFLSIFRIFLIPVFIVVYFSTPQDGIMWIPALIIVISGLTDCLDGFIARHFNMVTRLGKMLDPLADKLTQISIVGCLSLRYLEFRVLLVIYLVKELAMLTGGLWFMRRFNVVKVSRWFGKVATIEFYAAMALVLIFPQMPAALFRLLVIVTLFFALYAFIRYVVEFARVKRVK